MESELIVVREAHPIFHEIYDRVVTADFNEFKICSYILIANVDDGLLLWSTLSLALVFLPGVDEQKWKNKQIDKSNCQKLISMGFYIPKELDENIIYEQIISLRETRELKLR